MNVSDSNPIQFWPEDEAVYNDQVADGIDFVPYKYEHPCSVPVVLQSVEAVDPDVSLRILDCEGEEIDTLEFEKTSIGGVEGSDEVTDTIHFTNFNAWTGRAEDVALVDWVAGPNRVLLSGTNVDKSSEQLFLDYLFVPGKIYTITFNLSGIISGGGSFATFKNIISITDDAFNDQFTELVDVVSISGSTQITFTATEECKKIAIQFHIVTIGFKSTQIIPNSYDIEEVTPAVPATPPIYSIYDLSFLPSDYSLCDTSVRFELLKNGVLDWKSDIIKFSTTPRKGTLIAYKGYKNFDGIYYNESSDYRYIWIPGVFFHQRNPTEQKSIELSNSRLINTASALRKQKMLSISDTTDYMHTKIQSILAHAAIGSLQIQEVEWSVEEDYELTQRSPNGVDSYPLKPAKTYLTRRNYVKRNAL